ncbi:MAG: hypothetical protein U0736_23315 [Gemmataceae bacterium]
MLVTTLPQLDSAASPLLLSVLPTPAESNGAAVAALLAGRAAFPDPATVPGIAVTAAPASATTGRWQYLPDGGVRTNVPPVSAGAPLVLTSADRLRFVPVAGFRGRVALTYLARDARPGGKSSATAATFILVVNTAPQLS